jgi:DHA1 family tetracycline resistance protein-like MFS transporter
VDGFTGGNISVAQAYLSDITDEKNRAQGIGVVNAAFGSGFLFGPAFGALLAGWLGPRVPYFVSAVISLITISLTFFLLPESLTSERRAQRQPRAGAQKKNSLEMLRLPGIALLMVIAFAGQLAFFSFQSVWVLWADAVMLTDYPPDTAQLIIGVTLSLVGFVGVLTQVFLVKPIVKQFGERAMVAGGLFMRSIPWVMMVFFPVVAAIGVTAPLISFGNGLIVPGLVALLTYLVPPDERGYAIGLSESIQGLGRISAPLIAGWLFDNVGPSIPLGFAATIGFVSAALALLLWRLPINRSTPADERKLT